MNFQSRRSISIVATGSRRRAGFHHGTRNVHGSTKVKPHHRIVELENFYTTRKLVTSLMREDLPEACVSPEMKAQWAIGQWIEASKQLGIYEILTGAMLVPKIPSQDEYYEAYYNTHRSGIASMERTIECKQDLAQALVKILKDLRREDPTTWDATQQGGKTLDQAKAEILLELQGHDYVILDI
jgi:hypothetical protein